MTQIFRNIFNGLGARPLTTALGIIMMIAAVQPVAHAEDDLIGIELEPVQIADSSGFETVRSTSGVDQLAFGIAHGNSPVLAEADGEETVLFNIEYRPGHRYLSYTDNDGFDFGVAPFVGGYVGADSSAYGYVGFGHEFVIDDHFIIMPNTAVGLYTDGGDGPDLGHAIEFRSGIELAYRFDNKVQAGLALHHMSNASIGDRNPGTEHVTFYLNIPLDGSIF